MNLFLSSLERLFMLFTSVFINFLQIKFLKIQNEVTSENDVPMVMLANNNACGTWEINGGHTYIAFSLIVYLVRIAL